MIAVLQRVVGPKSGLDVSSQAAWGFQGAVVVKAGAV